MSSIFKNVDGENLKRAGESNDWEIRYNTFILYCIGWGYLGDEGSCNDSYYKWHVYTKLYHSAYFVHDWIPDLLDLVYSPERIAIWCVPCDGTFRKRSQSDACEWTSVFNGSVYIGRRTLRRCCNLSVCTVVWCNLSATET